MSLDASHYSPSPCSYKSAPPLGGFSLHVSHLFCSTSIYSHALLDCGASTCFIDKSSVRTHNIPTVRTSLPISVEAMDSRVLSSRAVTEATIPLVLNSGRTRTNSRSTSSQPPDIRLCWGYLGWRHTIRQWIGVTTLSLF